MILLLTLLAITETGIISPSPNLGINAIIFHVFYSITQRILSGFTLRNTD